jgi:dTDP-4-dehydrorhamnose 3,5-epimerase
MKIQETFLAKVLTIEPQVFKDARGFFIEAYQEKRYSEVGICCPFVQDNISYSQKGTLRGLHYQYPNEQDKLVQVLVGKVFDVAVDIRRGSPTFGEWTGQYLTADEHLQLFIPKGFAHGFCVVSETALVMYKCSRFYAPDAEGGVLWSDRDLKIDWPVKDPILSSKDSQYAYLREVPLERLPVYEKED